MKKLFASSFLFCITTCLGLLDASSTTGEEPSKSKEEICKPKKWAVSQIGLAFEERPNYADLYIFFNQLIKDRWYYELRLYGIRNFISNGPPEGITTTVEPYYTAPPPPNPITKDQRNQYGWGGITIFGHVFKLSKDVKFMPFFRFEARTNVSATYRDRFGNRLNALTLAYLFGGKLNMKVNDVFGIYAQYYGGYFRANFKGRGYYAKLPPQTKPVASTKPTSHAHINGLSGTFEFGAPYKICPLCTLTPYIQFGVGDNNIDYKYTVPPYNLNPRTGSNVVWAIKLAKEF